MKKVFAPKKYFETKNRKSPTQFFGLTYGDNSCRISSSGSVPVSQIWTDTGPHCFWPKSMKIQRKSSETLRVGDLTGFPGQETVSVQILETETTSGDENWHEASPWHDKENCVAIF